MLFQAIYYMPAAVLVHCSFKIASIQLLSGVLKGCPGFASLFSNALDPFSNLMHNKLREADMVIARACADDIGACRSRLRHLNVVAPIVDIASKYAGLHFKSPKCIIVPVCKLSDKIKKFIGKWLRRNIPQWAEFSMQTCTNLLGVHLGLGAGETNWIKQCDHKEKVHSIQHANPPPQLMHKLSTLGLSQLLVMWPRSSPFLNP